MATFYSRKYKELKVTLDPRGVAVKNGRTLIAGLKGDFPQGLTVEFQNGMYETNDPKIIKALRSNKNYGRGFFEEDQKVELTPEQARKENERKELAKKAAETDPKADEDSKKK